LLGGGLALWLGATAPAQTPKPAQAPAASSAKTTAAVVNGETITLDEVEAVLKQRPLSPTPLTAQQQRQLRLEAVSALIDDLLLRQFMRDKGPKIDQVELDKQMAALAAGLKAQNRTMADFCRDSQQTEAQVKAGVLSLLQMDAYVKQHCTDAELQKYYEANKDYFDQIKVRASHIVLRLPATASPGEREQAKQKLLAIKADVLAGKTDFASAAKANSHCPSAPSGGDIGLFTRKWMVEESFAKAAFALKVGDVSDVVETEFGLHLIKVTERVPGKPSTFAGVIDEVRDCHREEFRQSLLAQLRKAAQVQVTLP
jgi:peptidyl-prolyl cis-trans isomerase C